MLIGQIGEHERASPGAPLYAIPRRSTQRGLTRRVDAGNAEVLCPVCEHAFVGAAGSPNANTAFWPPGAAS